MTQYHPTVSAQCVTTMHRGMTLVITTQTAQTTAPTAVQRWMVMGMDDELEFVCEKCVHYEVCDRSSRMIWARLSKEKVCTDFMEVVRCKDCKHWLHDFPGCTDAIGRCEWANYMVGCNGYCVYGERKTDDDC